MCLVSLYSATTKIPDLQLKKDRKGYYGWKIYYGTEGDSCIPLNFGDNQKIGKWLNADDHSTAKTIRVTDVDSYESGFHVYVKRPYNEGKFVRKVYVKEIVARGYEYFDHPKEPTVVCKQIFIQKRRNR